jgi:uncharacterized protein with NAD-binding domain and iron-sulfur cluster
MGSGDDTIPKKRVTILGGGPAGLAAALALSATVALRARYDVTVYQAGWRLGGKCGQGRKGPANRIEINGTHYLFGAYDEAFDIAHTVFAELDAARDHRFGTFDSQFMACSTIAIKQFFAGNWSTWAIELPGDGKPPSTSPEPLSPGLLLRELIRWMLNGTSNEQVKALMVQVGQPTGVGSHVLPSWWSSLVEKLGGDVGLLEHLTFAELLTLGERLVVAAEQTLVQSLEKGWLHDAFVELLTRARAWVWDHLGMAAEVDLEVNRFVLLVDLACTVSIGALQDDVFGQKGFESIDGLDLRDWLISHGAHESTAWSAPIATWYNAIAAYRQGEVSLPDMSAGIGLQALLRLALTYRGAFAFQLSHEVGDSLIAPIHQVLANRGVKLMYFHRVRELQPSADGQSIDAIVIERQVELLSGDPASYQPFMLMPDGRPVWPDAPLLDQIKQPPMQAGELLSFYCPQVGQLLPPLRKGEDFDIAIYALPVATLPWVCPALLEQKPAWADMAAKLGTTETQSLRLWLYPTVEEMGWTYGQAVLSGYFEPLATWEDACQLISAESWPEDNRPGSIATLFGVLPGAPEIYPGPQDHSYPQQRQPVAEQAAQQFCTAYVGSLWPKATNPQNPVGLDWSELVTLDPGLVGPARLGGQSIRSNVGPVEAYTQVHHGTLKYRMAPDQTGYANLRIAGDWVRNGYEVGSVEGALIAGQLAARSIDPVAGEEEPH